MKVSMFIFSLVFVISSLAALFLGAEAVLTAYGKPTIPAEFWQKEGLAKLLVEWEMESVEMFLSGCLIFLQVFCVLLCIACKKIGDRIIMPQREYDSRGAYRGFIRKNLLLFSIGNLLLFLSMLGHIWEAIPRGDGSEIVLVCIFLGVPGLVFGYLTLPTSFSVIFLGEPTGYCYCDSCNHGSKKQLTITDKQHLYDKVGYETTTTTKGGTVTDVKTRVTSRRSVHRNTYSCVSCGSYFKKVE